MDIFGVLSFVGECHMFLYSMSAMGDGLTKLSAVNWNTCWKS